MKIVRIHVKLSFNFTKNEQFAYVSHDRIVNVGYSQQIEI